MRTHTPVADDLAKRTLEKHTLHSLTGLHPDADSSNHVWHPSPLASIIGLGRKGTEVNNGMQTR